MEFRMLEQTDLAGLADLWNRNTSKKDNLYKKLNEAEIKSKFFTNTKTYDILSYIAIDSKMIIGFISGVSIKNSDTFYLTFVLVDESVRRKKIGTRLLDLLESNLKKKHELKKIDIVFFNPIHLEWIIPGTISSDHPNAPGVDISSAAYIFMKHHGFEDYAIQNAYYKNIETYEYSEDILKCIKKLDEQGLTITYYDRRKHIGFEKLFIDLHNDSWKNAIISNINSENGGHRVLIVEKNGQICGFTGPLFVQESKRGNFIGIGIHSDYRGLGAGKVLFAALCMGFKDIGATYMTLFTGKNNPARKIYEHEGFEIVRTWADMRKKL